MTKYKITTEVDTELKTGIVTGVEEIFPPLPLPVFTCPTCDMPFDSQVLLDEHILSAHTKPSFSNTWISYCKDGDNSRLADQINLPLEIKWKGKLPVATVSRGIRPLYLENKVFFCLAENGISKVSIVAFNALTGDQLWTSKAGGVHGSNGMFSIAGGYIWGGHDHNGNWKVDINTGVLTLFGWDGAVMETYTNTDGNMLFAYGNNGVDSPNVSVRGVNLVGIINWYNSRNAQTVGIPCSYYGGYNGMGHISIHDNILYVPDGILWAYKSFDGSILWQTGVYPMLEKVGEVCHYGETVYNNGTIYTFGRKCIKPHVGTLWHFGYVAAEWDIPKIYAYNATDGALLFTIDLPEYKDIDSTVTLGNPYSLWLLRNNEALPFQMIISGDKIYVSTFHSIIAYSISTKLKIWEFKRTMPAFISTRRDAGDMVLAGNVLFVMGTYEPKLYALSATDGNKLWEFASLDGRLFAGMIVVDDYLFAATDGGDAYCLS